MTETPPVPVSLGTMLQGLPATEYGSDYREHCLAIYKTYLEMADRISQRRERANSFFLTVNTALIALVAQATLGTVAHSGLQLDWLVPMVGVALCYLWYRIIRSYRGLNSAKFKVLHEIERQLPLRPYDAEWESVGRGKDTKLYLQFTHIEGKVPSLFMAFHAAALLVRVLAWF